MSYGHPANRRTRACAIRPLFTLAAVVAAIAGPAGPHAASAQAPAKTEILWDTWGVPHVYARSDEEMGYAFGWAQARSHGDAILLLYGQARGRAAEYWGERYLPSDRVVRALDLPGLGRREAAALPPAMRGYVKAFADGFNAYARAHPDAITDSLEAVLPVTAGDVLAHGARALFTFVSATGNSPPLVGLDGLPPEQRPGSNTWAIGPSRSASGHAMLLQNPHLPWDPPLMHFYEAQLASPAGEVYGVTLLGLPVISIGFNDALGWSHTVNTVDPLDTYVLTLAPGGYRYDGGVKPFETRSDTIRVRQPDGSVRAQAVELRRSVQGPVVAMDDTMALAVRTTGLGSAAALEEWWDMGRAHDLASFQTALEEMALPMFNVSYADRDGHILYFFAGRVPERPFGDFDAWQGAVRGDTSATLWSRVLPFDSMPRIVDPPGGFIQNSNSPPWYAAVPSPLHPSDFPAYLAPVWLDMREQRGLHMLLADSSITYDELLSMRYSNHMDLADRVLPDLLPAAQASADTLVRRAGDVLARWDRSADADSRGAVLFGAWAAEVVTGFPALAPKGFARPWSTDAPLTTPTGLADPAAAAAALAGAAAKVVAAYGRLDVSWGEVNRLGDLPGNGAPGDPFGVFHVIAYAPVGGGAARQAVAGDTWVAAIEFAPAGPRAQAILTYGNASQPGSPHVRDQLGLESRKRMREVWRTRAAVEAHVEERTTLPPGGR